MYSVIYPYEGFELAIARLLNMTSDLAQSAEMELPKAQVILCTHTFSCFCDANCSQTLARGSTFPKDQLHACLVVLFSFLWDILHLPSTLGWYDTTHSISLSIGKC